MDPMLYPIIEIVINMETIWNVMGNMVLLMIDMLYPMIYMFHIMDWGEIHPHIPEVSPIHHGLL